MNNIEHPLKRVSLKVLEDWGMMLVDEVPDLTPAAFNPNEPVYMSWIELHGSVSGAVSIVAQKDFMCNLAGNLLGALDADDLSDEDWKDSFKEMGNVLAGNFITEAYGKDVVFDLLNPSVSEIPFTDLDRFTQRSVVFGFMADDKPVAMTFSIKK